MEELKRPKKVGRPKLSDDQKKEFKLISIRLDKNIYERITNICDKQKIGNLSDFYNSCLETGIYFFEQFYADEDENELKSKDKPSDL